MKDDGGPAFPRVEGEHFLGADGMSLRDWFAGMAITYVGNLKIESAREGVPLAENDWSQAGIATLAYDIADAMIAAREKSQESS